jgi:hypothetical protein
MPDRLIRPNMPPGGQHDPDDQLPDISQLVTTRLKPRQPEDEMYARQIAHHEAEAKRLVDLAAMLEQAVSALMTRLRLTSDPLLYAALQHNSADLQHFKLEVELLQAKHQNAIERLHAQK